MSQVQKRTVEIKIKLPMEFPSDWDDKLIDFHLNDGSWCMDNFIDLLDEYSKKHGCICEICEAKVL